MSDFTSGKLLIKKRTLSQWLVLFAFAMPLFLSFFTSFLGIGSFIKYTIDVAWLLAFCLTFFKRKLFLDRNVVPFVLFVLGFFMYTLVLYAFNFQSYIYYLWGFRNNFRFLIFFLLCAILLTEDDATNMLRFLDALFWINIIVSFFQYFVLGYKQDYLGGIFGVDRGCNGYSIVLFAIVIIKSIVSFMDKKENILLCTVKCLFALVIAAMAELKIFFVMFVIIIFISVFFTRFSWQKPVIVLIAGAALMVSGSVLTEIFGSNEQLSLDRIMELITSTSYATENDLGRITAIPILSRTILTEPIERLFGLGLGNCETSSFAICNTPFFEVYGGLNYTWLSSAFLFLETGIVGLLIYISFFVMCMVFAIRQFVKKKGNRLFSQMTIIMSVICIILVFYNSSLRFEVAYMSFFVLALPLISAKSAVTES